MTAPNPIPIESTSGIGERGNGWPRRMARSFALQRRKLVNATKRQVQSSATRTMSAVDMDSGNSWVAATPVAIRARAVRFPASDVCSSA